MSILSNLSGFVNGMMSGFMPQPNGNQSSTRNSKKNHR